MSPDCGCCVDDPALKKGRAAAYQSSNRSRSGRSFATTSKSNRLLVLFPDAILREMPAIPVLLQVAYLSGYRKMSIVIVATEMLLHFAQDSSAFAWYLNALATACELCLGYIATELILIQCPYEKNPTSTLEYAPRSPAQQAWLCLGGKDALIPM
jgi:hypothetical protein